MKNNRPLILFLFLLPLFFFFMNNIFAQQDLYKVIYLKGEVEMERSGQKRKIMKGDYLIVGDGVITSAKGIVILGFGHEFKSRMKMGPQSSLVLEGKKADEGDISKGKKTFFLLNLGNIVVNYLNKNKDKNKLKVRTKLGTMGVRGTEFFIHTSDNGETLTAVKSGVVMAKHRDKKVGTPLSSKEGIIFTTDGASELLNPPDWYNYINWELEEGEDKDIDFYLHDKKLDKLTVESLINKFVVLNDKDGNLKNQLQGDLKVMYKKCSDGEKQKCTELGLYLLKNGRIEEVKSTVLSLFKKSCSLGEPRACVWVGRVEFEFGKEKKDKLKGIEDITKLCHLKNTYACFSLWEIYKSDFNGQEEENEEKASLYLQKALGLLHGLSDFDTALSEFEQGCLTENGVSCLNFGILLEQLDKKDKALEIYKKGCSYGSGAACSNLGFLFQSMQKIEQAKKHYTKACFMDETYGCYNLACIYSKENKIELSLQYLKMAISGGFDDWNTIEGDADLELLKKDKSYAAFINEFKAASKPEPVESK